MLDWKKHKLESRLPGEISITSDMQMTPPTLVAESEEELKSLMMKVKEESEKVVLKLNIQKTKIMASSPITSWQINREMLDSLKHKLESKLLGEISVSSDMLMTLPLCRK